MAAFSEVLEPPVEFPFPFEPYGIQKDFMKCLYQTLEEGKIGIFESPTGTGKSLSIICGSLKWLCDHEEKEKRRLEALLAGDMSALPPLIDEKKEKEGQGGILSEWFSKYDQDKRFKEEVYRIKLAERRRVREERVKRLKEQYGSSLFRKKPVNTASKDNLIKGIDEEDEETDIDLVLEEYHSEDEKDICNSIDSDHEEEMEEENVLKIFYASRTHSQLTQFVHEVQKTPYKEMVSLVPLGSRQTFCLNETVTSLRSISLINDRCIELQKNKKKSSAGSSKTVKSKRQRTINSNGCPYYKPVAMETIRDLALGEIHDIEQLVTLGREIKGCPYYGTRYAVPLAQIVVLPYNLLLHAETRQAVGINLKGNIVIIDEAHNLIETISSVHSVHITLTHIKKTYSQLTNYRGRYQSRLKAKNLMYIDQLLYLLSSFQRLLEDTPTIATPTNTTADQEHCQLLRLNEFLLKTKTDNINMFKVLQYCKKSEIAKKLNGFAECYLKEETTATPTSTTPPTPTQVVEVHDKSSPRSPLMILEQFISSLTSNDKDCRIVVKKLGLQSSLKYLLLNPSIHFTSIVQEARAVIVAGGTMQPFSEFKDQLLLTAGVPSSRLVEFSCGHVIDKGQLLPLVLSKGPSGTQFNFTFEHRQDKTMIEELGRAIANIVTVVPGGVVCFFPSYEYEKTVYTTWERAGLLERIGKRKQVFREPKLASQVDPVLSQYARCIEFNTDSDSSSISGALLLCVVGGKLSEGINFSDHLGRCIMMIGLPYPNIKSPELVEKMDYMNSTQSRDSSGRLPGAVHYENLCMRAVNQSIGRAIRHAKDYAVIILVDDRYSNSSVYTKLPNWISSQLLITSSFGQGFSAVRKV